MRPVQSTLPHEWIRSANATDSDTLLVLLPGAWDSLADFRDSGLVDLIHHQRPDWDMVLVDAHMGYYRKRSFLPRLHQDILQPTNLRNYRRIWISGPSLGGFGSLMYACSEFTDPRIGAIAIAPYLGGNDIVEDVTEAGGAMHWQPGSAGEPHERDLWQCLGTDRSFPLWMGWGSDDSLAEANQLLANTLPTRHVVVQPGGHKWTVWVPIWRELLHRMTQTDDGR